MKSELNHSSAIATNHKLTFTFHFFDVAPNHKSKVPRSKADKRIFWRILLFSLFGLCESCVQEGRALFSLLFLLTEAQGVFDKLKIYVWCFLVAGLKAKTCLTAQCVQTASYLLNAMDQTADPCVDFFQFACGSWNRKHIIPEDRSSVSTFEVLADQLQIILKAGSIFVHPL